MLYIRKALSKTCSENLKILGTLKLGNLSLQLVAISFFLLKIGEVYLGQRADCSSCTKLQLEEPYYEKHEQILPPPNYIGRFGEIFHANIFKDKFDISS